MAAAMPWSSRSRKSWFSGPVPGLQSMLLPRTVCLVRKRTAAGRGWTAGGQMARNRRSIAGRPAMITGAASGIGRSLARLLSRTGSPVAIADIDETGLKETAQSLRGPVLVRVLDVADAADQARFAAEVREWLPAPLGAVFNNAG